MAVLYKWFGLVLYALTCLAIAQAKCRRRTVLTDLQGTISDGPGSYPDKTLCEWLIKGPYPNVSITLTFIEFATECSYDFLFIHDGDSYRSPLIGTFSGNTLPSTIVAHSGQMLIILYSDTNYSLEGFTAIYTIDNCTQGCSGNGACKDGFCQCIKLYHGEACDLDACPSLCHTAKGHGQCDFVHAQSHCVCNKGYIGESCSLSTLTDAESNTWLNISSTSSVFTPRIAHSVVYIERSDTLLAFGGYSLNKVFDDLLQFNFSTSLWSEINPAAPKPVGRFSHTASLYLDSIVLFGGELQDGSLINDLWLYNITLNKWTELAVNDSVKPPPLAEHTATLVDDKLYIFGGRTASDYSSSAMYSYSLSSQSGWVKVSYKRGNEHHLRMLGHSAVYYADMRSLIIFGGFVPNRARFSVRTNKLLAFHLDLEVWSNLAVTAASGDVPQGRAFHTAVLVGDYMVIYGGNTHIHSEQEICYQNKLVFYHLKCQKWISSTLFDALSQPSSSTPQRGRFSHHAVLQNGTVMLVIGGFNGQPLGDVLGYKLPIAVAAKNYGGVHCKAYSTEKSCKDDPECGWCSSGPNCLSLGQSGSCGVPLLTGSCPGLCAVFTQCSSCLSFGNTNCGWCVQDSRCYPRGSPTGACQNVNKDSLRGWWGTSGQFLTSFNKCQSSDLPPGITVVENKMNPKKSLPDGVRIALMSKVKILREPQYLLRYDNVYTTQIIGFVYPFKYLSAPWRTYEMSLSLDNAKFSEAKLWMSTDDTEANSELVASCKSPVPQICSEKAMRSNSQTLFPSPSEDKRYFIRAEVNKSLEDTDNLDSVFSLKWNRTSSDTYVTEALSGQFLQPYASSDCSVHKTCLGCMTDAACGWCLMACVSRNTTSCLGSDGNSKHLTLNATECTVCSDHVDCSSCIQDGNCVWGTANSRLGCYRQGQLISSVVGDCGSPCSSRKTCDSCLSDNVGCTWCDNTESCFVFGTYTSRYPYGQCSHWIDSNGAGAKCPNCSRHTNCQSCLADFRCGWCGNDYDPRIGRCNHDCGEHGVCGADYNRKCDLGWLGENCTTDCGGNGHSDCSQGIGICDECPDAPTVTIQQCSTSVTEGDNATLYCNATGSPVPNTAWIRASTGDILSNQKAYTMYMITDIKRSESGSYKCLAWNGIGNNGTKSCTIDVNYSPSIFESGISGNQTVNEGDEVKLNCSADGKPTPTITWKKVSDNNVVYFPLTITSKQDEGFYRCTADNGAGNPASRDVAIIVQNYHPINTHVTTDLIDNTVVVNANFNLTCSAQANPPAKYRFYREQGSLFNTTTGRNVAVYTVSVSERINEVKFSCTPFNDFGDGTTTMITVTVHFPPEIKLQNKYFVRREEGVSLHCQVEGYPAPAIKWTPCIPQGNVCTNSRLNISNVQTNADLKCTVTNTLGNASANTSLIIGAKKINLTLRITSEEIECAKGASSVWEDLQEAVKNIFANKNGYVGARLLDTRCGSLIVDLALEFGSVVSEAWVISTLRKGITDGKLGGFPVHASSIVGIPVIESTATPPTGKTTAKPSKEVSGNDAEGHRMTQFQGGHPTPGYGNNGYEDTGSTSRPPAANAGKKDKKGKKKQDEPEKPVGVVYAQVDKSKRTSKPKEPKNLYDQAARPSSKGPGELQYAAPEDLHQGHSMPRNSAAQPKKPEAYTETQYAVLV